MPSPIYSWNFRFFIIVYMYRSLTLTKNYIDILYYSTNLLYGGFGEHKITASYRILTIHGCLKSGLIIDEKSVINFFAKYSNSSSSISFMFYHYTPIVCSKFQRPLDFSLLESLQFFYIKCPKHLILLIF